MILTNKAKEDFIDYLWESKLKKEDYKKYEDYIENQKKSHTYADIITWFDSVGIYISVFKDYSTFEFYINDDWEGGEETRQEATQEAIIKANEIYNVRYSKQKQVK